MPGDFDEIADFELDDFDEDDDMDELDEGESGTFVDPGVEDEEVDESEAVWDERELGEDDDDKER